MSVLDGSLVVVRLEASSPFPAWLPADGFLSITRTAEEVSIVCPQSFVPSDVTAEPGWGAIRIEGPLDFNLVGILASIATVLADSGISLFAISTFETDYVLVREAKMSEAVAALRQAGHRVRIANRNHR